LVLAGALFLGVKPAASGQEKAAFQKRTLDNGLVVVSQKDGASAVTTLEIMVRGGQKADPAGKEGLAYLTTRLTLEIPDQSKVQELLEKSSRYMMGARGDYSLIHIECLSEFLEPTLDVFLRILKDPLFSGVRIDRAKDYMNEQRKIESDDNVNVGHLANLRTFLEPYGYGRTIYGTEESLAKIKARDIEAFYKDGFRPANMAVLVISDLENDRLTDILQKSFGSFPAGKAGSGPASNASAATPEQPQVTYVEKDTKQTLVSMGFVLPKTTARTYALSMLLEGLLGKGPGSALWPLRTDLKLAYNVNAQSTIFREGGILEAFLETDKSKTEAAQEALKAALTELQAKGISEETLKDTRTFVHSNFLRTNETKDRRVATLCGFEALGLGYEFFRNFFAELDALSLEEFNGFLKDVLDPAKAALVIVGPKKT